MPLLTALVVLLGLAVSAHPRAAQRPRASAAQASAAFADIDRLVADAMAAKLLPGAVVLVGKGDETIFEKAYGMRAVVPAQESMTLDTIFDMASLTKVVATTTAVMQLVEQGRLRLSDSVASVLPGFERYGKGEITIRHLLTHVSGLRPDVDLGEPWTGYDAAIELARNEVPTSAPGERFVYSDINFFVLGDIVARMSGQSLDAYTMRAIFEPLGMVDSGFLPPARLVSRIAPTERCSTLDAWPCKRPDAMPLRGLVHDPTSRRMGGVAGHAGLFSTAQDMARFARMLINEGRLGQTRVLAPATVARMTSPATPSNMASVRGLGWDIDTSYSANRGDLFPVGSYGHTGFTGTSLWVDPTSRSFVVFLSSRLHPDGTGDVGVLRAKVATVAAAALGVAATDRRTLVEPTANTSRTAPESRSAPVLTGIDVLVAEGFARLKGKHVGLVTNHTGRARDGKTTIDLLHTAPGVQLVALFSPEHGIRGILDASVSSSRDEKTGLLIHSLYGETQRPTDAMLQGIDTLVVDLQDVGVRFYTYHTTMGYVMEEAANRKIAVWVLDRPNPVNGWQIEGPALDPTVQGFIAYHSTMPVRHGMTMGELARLFNVEKKIGADLTVVPMANWRRDNWFDDTGLSWINPSPNMRNLNQATLYPGIGAIEYSNVSVGRGTDQPFEQLGAPWIDGPRLAAALNARKLPGIRFYPVSFTPTSSKYAGEACQGVFMVVTNRASLSPVRVGLEVAAALSALHGDRYRFENTDRLIGSRTSLERVRRGEDPATVVTSWAPAEAAWRRIRAQYLLYH
ncbi:MAG: exo-beta-N-acetylmuramidase NamZ domain-containing protein [Vicinamibacterales bacterium]